MLLRFLLLVLTLNSASTLSAQSGGTAPVVWERYRLASIFSVEFPKLPIRFDQSDICRSIASASSYAYARGRVYEAVVVGQHPKQPSRSMCNKAVSTFGPNTFADRLAEIRNRAEPPVETSITVAGLKGHRFTSRNQTRIVVSDLETNGAWIELAVTHYPETPPSIDKFISSLELNGSGKKVSDGAPVMLGDRPAEDQDLTAGDPPITSGAIVVVKPRPSYTEQARRENLEGLVILRVTLLANGSVGTITPVKNLKYGLTNEAIAAARRLVFLPKRENGVPVDTTLTFEYSFDLN